MTDGLNNKNQQLIDLVTLTNEKLDQVITLLGGIPTATKTTDDLYDILTDIHTDTQSMDAKLLAIRNYIKDPSEDDIPGDFTSLLWNLYLLRRGTVLESNPTNIMNIQAMLSYVAELLSDELSAIASYTLDTRNHLFYGFTNLGVTVADSSEEYGGYLAVARGLMSLIQGAIGVPVDGLTYPDKGQRDIIQLLERAASRPESTVGTGLAPLDVCSDAYISSGMSLVPGLNETWTATTWAVFPDPPPPDIEFHTTFGLGVGNTQLHPVSESWEGFSIYVASSARSFGTYIGPNYSESLARYPTNTWIDIGFLTVNLSVFVPGTENLRVWLCGGSWGGDNGGGGSWGSGGGGGGGWGGCIDLSGEQTTITQPNSSTNTIHYIPMSLVTGASFIDRLESPTGGFYIATASDWVEVGNWNGVTVQVLSGNGIRLLWQRADLSFGYHVFSSVGEEYTITEDCTHVTLDNFSGVADGDISCRICPPGVTP